ncbi:MAG: ion transporter [Planctomycetota bacterium]
MEMMAIRGRVWRILDTPEEGDRISRAFDLVMGGLITLAVGAVVAETVPALQESYGKAFNIFEWITLTVFATEYLGRLWTCKESARYAGAFGRLRWMASPMAIIDLLAIAPGFIPGGVVDMRFLRAIRLIRLFRLTRCSQSMRLLSRVIADSARQLLVALVGALILLVCASSVLYFMEGEAQPEAFGSIPKAMWWGVVTLTTVGYGDVYPVTIGGKICAAFVAFLGVGMFALPAGILAGAFEVALEKEKRARICPHCGNEIEP